MEIYNFTSKTRYACGSHSALPVKVIEMQVIGPLSWLLNQSLGVWGWGQRLGVRFTLSCASQALQGILMHSQARERHLDEVWTALCCSCLIAVAVAFTVLPFVMLIIYQSLIKKPKGLHRIKCLFRFRGKPFFI